MYTAIVVFYTYFGAAIVFRDRVTYETEEICMEHAVELHDKVLPIVLENAGPPMHVSKQCSKDDDELEEPSI